jgi:hypothetical protein
MSEETRITRHFSEKRAFAVKAYFVAAGLIPSRLTTHGSGASHPVSNDTELDRSQNRRVEVVKNSIERTRPCNWHMARIELKFPSNKWSALVNDFRTLQASPTLFR